MNSPESFNFGRKIKDLKRAYNKTYADLTSGLKISRERIIQLEENEREPTDLERRRFAEYYALPVEEFGPFGGGAMPSPAPRPYGNPPVPGNTFEGPRPGPAYPPTNYSNERPPRENYGNERPAYGNDRPPRENYGNERPPMYNNRGNYGDRGNYGNDRPPRENYGNERPPRENYGNERPPYENRGNYNERPPRENYGNERPPRENYGNERPPYDNNRGNYNNRGDNMGNLRTPPGNRPPGNFTPRPQGNFQSPRPPMGNGRPPVDEDRPAAPKPANPRPPAPKKPAANGDSKEPKPVMKYTAEQLGDIESAYLRKQRDLKVPLKFTFLNGKEYTGVVVDFTPFTVHIIEQDTNEEVILRKLAMAYYRKADALEEAQAAQAQGGGASEEV